MTLKFGIDSESFAPEFIVEVLVFRSSRFAAANSLLLAESCLSD
jgi:hypothetical protein